MPMNPKLVTRAPSLADQVAESVAADIRRSHLRPGEKLPTELRLAETYGVSRAVVREAVSRLKSAGLVRSVQGRGMFVADGAEDATLRMAALDVADPVAVAHGLQLFSAVEVAATGCAALAHGPADLERIRARHAAFHAAIAAGASGAEEERAFHREITRAAGNPFLAQVSEFLDHRVRGPILAVRRSPSRFPGLPAQIEAEHAAILEALSERDPVRARAEAERHLANTARRLQLYVARREGAPADHVKP